MFLFKRRPNHVDRLIWENIQREGGEKNNLNKTLNGLGNNRTHQWDKTERSGNGLHYYNHVKKAKIKKNNGKRG